MAEAVSVSQPSRVLPLELDRRYPVLVKGEGVWVEDATGRRYLDAMSGGSMAATLGHGRRDLVAAARAQADRLTYVHNERLTNPAHERLGHALAGLAPAGGRGMRWPGPGTPRARRASRPTLGSRSARLLCPPTPRPPTSGRGWPSGASGTGS